MTVQRAALVLGVWVLLCGCIFGQTTTGTLVGTVADPDDAAVPGVHVELRNIATGAVIATTTGTEGIFRFNSLVPATYSLTIKPPPGSRPITSRYRSYRQRSARLGQNRPVAGRADGAGVGHRSRHAHPDGFGRELQADRWRADAGHHPERPRPVRHAGDAARVSKPRSRIPPARTPSDGAHQWRHRRPGELHGGWDRRHGHREQHHPALRAEHGFDRRNARADHQLPGGIRPQLQRHHQRGDQGRQPGVPRQRLGQQAARDVQCQELLQQLQRPAQKSIYRFFVWGYSIGGPVYIPKLFNTDKKKLFFFFSQEYTKQKPATQIGILQHADRGAAGGRLRRLHRHATACRFSLPTPPPGTRFRTTTSQAWLR